MSDCDVWSDRSDYVDALASYIDVDVYGKCGKDCGKISDCKKIMTEVNKFVFMTNL